jgi:methionyl-tRNA formyltransferase
MVFNKGIVFLSTDTNHHRYLIKKFESENIFFDQIFFETTFVKPPFKTEPFEKKNFYQFEKKFFEDFSNKINLKKVCYVENINNKKVYNYLRKKRPRICIVFGTRKIEKKIIDLFKPNKFMINIHRGIMSRYRGLDSDLWAILEDKKNFVGITIHQIEEKLDSGKVFFQKKLKMNSYEIYQIRYHTTILAVRYLITLIKNIFMKKNVFKKKIKLGKYYSFMPLRLKKICKLKLQNEK